jgi:hypothetical protein
MPLVITEKSSLACAHKGTVTPTASQSKLKVAGAGVLVSGDLKGKTISLCTTVPNPNTSTLACLAIQSEQGGVAGKLKVAGTGVLLETVSGQTTGTVGGTPQTWSVQDAGQSKLKAS